MSDGDPEMRTQHEEELEVELMEEDASEVGEAIGQETP